MTHNSDDSISSSTQANVLDLTDEKTLFELAVESYELVGQAGAKLIAELKEKAAETDYSHLYFRDPMRPGIVWFVGLQDFDEIPTRGRLEYCRQMTEKVFPKFLAQIEAQAGEDPDENQDFIHAQIPPIIGNISGFELATALEYLVFVYPSMVRAWAALIFTYGEMLHIKEGAERTQQACMSSCQHPEIVSYFLGDSPEGFSS